MKRILLIFSLFIFPVSCCFSQAQLFFQNFETAATSFTLNNTASWNNTGNNMWIVDSNYFAGGIYPKTINEDSTYGGTISYAPYGHYMHIYDSASGYLNDNYNPSDSSDRFASMTTGICTMGLTDVTFNFFYLCEGSPSAYGMVYYSADNGPWTQVGSPLNNKHKWQYVTMTNPAFNDVANLQFGFRWINNKTTGHDTSGLGIDDISMFGTYDSIHHPITCKFSNILSDSCLGSGAYVYIIDSLSDSLCDAVWDMDMSGPTGNFPGSLAWYQTLSSTVGYWFLEIPNTYTEVGSCYRFKMVMTTYPYLSFIDSFCFPFDSCPGSITPMQPAVTLDTNPVCAGSAIIVPFTSTGTYKSTNVYTAELIDSVGNSIVTYPIGALISSSSFPNYPYGSIPGNIPLTAPAGCKYYIKVVSTTPNRQEFEWGPFCIQHCDILTNSQQGVLACLGSCYNDPSGFTDTISYNIHEFDNNAKYYSSNDFKVQVLSSTNFVALNTGGFGLVLDTTSGTMQVHIPCADSLTNVYGIPPGLYYMRVVATNSNFTDSSLGSLVFLDIGELPDSLYLTVTPPSGPYCLGTTLTFSTNPDDQYSIGSTYSWWVDHDNIVSLFNGWNQGYLGYNPPSADTFQITVQETNYGCVGPKATLSDTIVIIGLPKLTKTGPTHLCIGDTGTYSIPFANNTSYRWEVPSSADRDTANNILKIKFNSTGVQKITVVAINACFADSISWNIAVDSCLLGVQNINSTQHVNVYPNPSTGQFTFSFSGENYSGSRIEVYNVLGEIISNEEISDKNTMVDLGSNPNGVYYYRIIYNSGNRASYGKLIIEK
jgi:hypothetical protein